MFWLNYAEFWYWLIAGIIMLIFEVLIPAAWFLWMGVSALIVGMFLYFVPSTLFIIQIIIFGAVSVISFFLYKKYQKSNLTQDNHMALNRRGEQYIGQVFTLIEPIVDGVGRVKINGSIWRVSGREMPAQTKIKVLSINGNILNIEEAKKEYECE